MMADHTCDANGDEGVFDKDELKEPIIVLDYLVGLATDWPTDRPGTQTTPLATGSTTHKLGQTEETIRR